MSDLPTDSIRRIDALFDAAVDLPAVQCEAFIAAACADDEGLREEVLELVRAYHAPSGFLGTPAVLLAAPILDAAAAYAGPVPERIGAFRVVREIGRGGMGRVFLGEREGEQFEQRVAIKVIQNGAPGIVRRFIDERRILARLQHPNIARLVDGGITPDGLTYFAMELIDGEPIDHYCARRDLSMDRRLDLFASVCEAVTYAHGHLIVHRDLKPSNILVAADGQVKLLDFGIAKVLDAGQDTTRTELCAMTPEFAAPEQVRGEPVSTATDVYSLGVLLYTLLAGVRPYDVRAKTPAEIERIVCVDVPAAPSSKAPAPTARRIRGDLDLIVMTALHKQPERRYASPAALAADLQRFRQGHAILARDDSRRHRLRKFVGRHRTGVVIAALFVLGLLGAVSRERALRHRAEIQARKATEVENFLIGVFAVADPDAGNEPDGGSITARELLDRGASRIDSTLADQPEVQAELGSVLGRVYTNLGLYDRATLLLERSLAQRRALYGPADARVAGSMDLLGAALVRLDRYDEAEPLLRRALEQRRRLLGGRDSATAGTLNNLATLLEQRSDFAAAEPLYREVLAIRRELFGDTALQVANSMNNLGLILYRRGIFPEAESLYQRALAIKIRRLGERHFSTAATMQNLAQLSQSLGRYEDAEAYHRRALAVKRERLGDAHPSVTISLNNLADLLIRMSGRLDEAEMLVREALMLDRRMFGEEHSYVAESLANLGEVMHLKGDFGAADTLFRRALTINRAVLGEHHVHTAHNLASLAQTRYALGDGDGAIEHMRQSLAIYRQLLGDDHRSTVITTGNLGFILAGFGDAAEAESLARAAQRRLDPDSERDRVPFITSQLALGKALLAQGRAAEALPVIEEVITMATTRFGERHHRTGEALLTYGRGLAAQRRFAEARRALLAARVAVEDTRDTQPRLLAQVEVALGEVPR